MISLLVGILLVGMIGFVLAEQGNLEKTSMQERLSNNTQAREELREELQANAQERKELQSEVRENIRQTLKDGEELNFAEKRIIMRRINSQIMELRTLKTKIRTRLNLTNGTNASELRARLSNGRNAQIKIMPDTASERALARLRLKYCNETTNCTIELKEVGEGNRTRAVYEARARKTFKLFGFIKNHEDVLTRIDAETGEEIEIKRPWWAWMASESDEADEIEK